MASTCGCGCTCGCGWFAEEVNYLDYVDKEESEAEVQGSRWQFIRLQQPPPPVAINVNNHLRVSECQRWSPLSIEMSHDPLGPHCHSHPHLFFFLATIIARSIIHRLAQSHLPPFAQQQQQQQLTSRMRPLQLMRRTSGAQLQRQLDAEEQSREDASREDLSEEGVEDLNKALHDLVGAKTSGLDDLNYSSHDDNDDYFQKMKDKARFIKYCNVKKVCHGRRQTNIIPGGPKPPNYSGMSSAELTEAKKEYKRERKQYTDGLRMKRLNAQNKDFEPDSFTGCLSLTLRPMMEVISFLLDVNHNFPNKEILTMRVAKEANLHGIIFVCSRSDVWYFKCTSYRFCVIAHQSKHRGWLVSTACIREGDEFVDFDNTPTKEPPEKPTLPFWTKWIVPLILLVIVDTPGISNKNLKQFLLRYGEDHVLSDSILQEARSEAKAQLFGKSEENVQYAKGMKRYLERSGHIVKLRYTSRKETVRNVERLVVSKELLHLKAKDNSTLDKEGRSTYWNTWKEENYYLLVNQLGYKTTKGHFLHGVFYAPSFSKAAVPELQTVFMAGCLPPQLREVYHVLVLWCYR